MKSIYLKTAITAVLMGVTAVAFAKGPPEGKGPPDGGEEGGNKLALPAVLVGGPLSNFVCGAGVFGNFVAPSGDPQTGYDLDTDAYYYIQGDPDNPWQAACKQIAVNEQYEAVDVFGAWGDNLVGDAKLKVGSPIRVEIVLYEGDTNGGMAAPTQDGWVVEKLEPSMLDRESPYGILAVSDDMGGYSAIAEPLTAVVYDRDAHLTISQPGTTTPFVDEDIAPEINATGKIVYGYNLRVTELGAWVITFTMPNLNFVGCDLTGVACAGNIAAIEIDVIGGGGGGGGKPNR